jgi:hypothetical protein
MKELQEYMESFQTACHLIYITKDFANKKRMKQAIKIIAKIVTNTFLSMITLIFLIAITFTVQGIFTITPKRLLQLHFNISLKDFDYTVKTIDYQWCGNGDGYRLTIYKFNKLTTENIEYLSRVCSKPLPISETDIKKISCNRIPKDIFKSDTGYYIFEILCTYDDRDYKVFIVDTEKKIAVHYFQYM